jgi:threonine dehydratase
MSVSDPVFSAADVRAEVEQAETRIRPYVRETPLEYSPMLSEETGARVFLKLETAQVTGSFKARGAFNKLLTLDARDRAAGIVTASTGNHALATAHALTTLGIDGEIFLPASASAIKVDALRARGARLRLVDADPGAVEVAARAHAGETGRTYVSPYNDPQVIGGQGTIAVELRREVESIDVVVVPVGGGGLIAGVAGYFKAVTPRVEIVGCQPRASAVMAHSVDAGRLLELPAGDSLSDATLGAVEQGSITFPICKTCVDGWELLDETDLRSAVRVVAAHHSILIEGAAALAVATLRQRRGAYRDRTVVLILSGAHIALPALASILAD